MRCRSYTLLAVILTAACARAQVASSPPSELSITGATLIDGTGAPPLSNAVVLIKGDRIMAVGKHPKIRIPRDASIIDARGGWIIPGLVDAHVHFFQSGGLYTRPDVIDLRKRRPYEQELKWIHDHLLTTFSRYLCSGITAAVDVGGPNWNFTVRELAAHTAKAPRVAVAGPLVSTYAPEKLQTADPPIIKVSTPDEARALVRRDIAHNPDLLKIWFIRTPNAKLEDLI